MEKTLIIHPKDESTSFLDIIYKDIQNKTVITGGVSKTDLMMLINEHDRIMMMGHGSPLGLFSMGQFYTYAPYIIDYLAVPNLLKKTDNVYIWCNADKFVTHHGLQGFYSGMFISEVVEADYCGLSDTTNEMVDESNLKFCDFMAKYIDKDKHIILENVKKEYGELALTNQVALYNNNRLFKS